MSNDMLSAHAVGLVHGVCYHGTLIGRGDSRGDYIVWECDHHHGSGDPGRVNATDCAQEELDRRKEPEGKIVFEEVSVDSLPVWGGHKVHEAAAKVELECWPTASPGCREAINELHTALEEFDSKK